MSTLTISTDDHLKAWMTAPLDRRAASHAALVGDQPEHAEPEEPWNSLKEISAQVRKHPVWLAKLRVPEVCGERLAGRKS